MKFNLIFFLCLSSVSVVFSQDNSVNEAKHFISTGNFQEAVDLLDVYIQDHPDDTYAYITRAIANGSMGRINNKTQDLKYAKFLNPYAQLYINDNYRSILYEKKSYDYNFSDLSADFNKSPVEYNYYKDYLDRVIEMHSQDSLLTEAILSLNKNEVETTESILKKIQPSSNINHIISDIKGLIELKKNNTLQAIEYFTSSINEDPSFSLAYHNRAIAYKQLGEFEKAKNDLYNALALNENISIFYFTLAKISEIVDDNEEAEKNYSMALDINPDYLEARTNYSLLQKTLGNYKEAIQDLGSIILQEDESAKINYIKGGIHFTYGEYEKSIEEFDTYLDLYPEDDSAIFNKGLAKILMGKKEEGCEEVLKSLDNNPEENREEIYSAFCKE